MILQGIVEAFDAELDKLYKLRAIIAGLEDEPELALEEQDATEVYDDEAIASATEKPAQKTRRRSAAAAGVPRVRAARKQAMEPTALSGPIPKGPVVVMPAALAKELATKAGPQLAKAERERAPEPGSLGSMIRALHLERLA